MERHPVVEYHFYYTNYLIDGAITEREREIIETSIDTTLNC